MTMEFVPHMMLFLFLNLTKLQMLNQIKPELGGTKGKLFIKTDMDLSEVAIFILY